MGDARLVARGYPAIVKVLRPHQSTEYLVTVLRFHRGQPFPAPVMFPPDREYRFAWGASYEGPAAREAVCIVDSSDPNGVN